MVRVVPKIWTMSEAAGASARAIRQAADATLADVAKAAKEAGLPWSSGRVGDFESGRIAASLPTLLAVSGALSTITQGDPIGLPDLFAVEGHVQINDTIVVTAERLRKLLSGGGFRVTLGDLGAKGDDLSEKIDRLWDAAYSQLQTIPEHMRPSISRIALVRKDFTEGDERLARSLGVSQFIAAALMEIAWQQTFVQKRDKLAGPSANAQKKGIAARRLNRELKNLQRRLDL